MAEQRLEASDRVDSLRINHSRSGIKRSSRYTLRKDGDKGKGNYGCSARLPTRKREARGNCGTIYDSAFESLEGFEDLKDLMQSAQVASGFAR